jgi:RNA-directed DNA polymerase
MNEIRYTRYADDLTFSGNIDVARLLHIVDVELKYLGLQRNEKKLKVMHRGTRQQVTGVSCTPKNPSRNSIENSVNVI